MSDGLDAATIRRLFELWQVAINDNAIAYVAFEQAEKALDGTRDRVDAAAKALHENLGGKQVIIGRTVVRTIVEDGEPQVSYSTADLILE
jgi:hypothetical protein